MSSKSVVLLIVLALLFEATVIVVAKNIQSNTFLLINPKCRNTTGWVKINGHCYKIFDWTKMTPNWNNSW